MLELEEDMDPFQALSLPGSNHGMNGVAGPDSDQITSRVEGRLDPFLKRRSFLFRGGSKGAGDVASPAENQP